MWKMERLKGDLNLFWGVWRKRKEEGVFGENKNLNNR